MTPESAMRTGALLGALIFDNPTVCSKAALGVFLDSTDWLSENFG